MMFASVEELNAETALFTDPQRPAAENLGPHLRVFDDFYEDPFKVRETALACEYFQYSPPLENQVGAEIAARFSDQDPRWLATSLQRYHGRPVNRPEVGFRYNADEVRDRLAGLLGEQIHADTWHSQGDGWNGAFHLQYAGTSGNGWSIHHHYKPGDVTPRGWSGLVYLSPEPPPDSGTTLWLDKRSGRCIAEAGALFDRNTAGFEKVFSVENRFNRLVLFRENVLHRAEPGFGDDDKTGRLTQTFFFLSDRRR